MIGKYEMLVNALDDMCAEAPAEFPRYNMIGKTEEEINNLRSNAYIHLFLLVKFGIQDFSERYRYITDGPDDGGIDAYYINKEEKVVYLIQSKYRTNVANYENKEIEADEIAAMEIKNIVNGGTIGDNGREYNGKIIKFQEAIRKLNNLSLYDYKIIILANLYSSKKIKVVESLIKGYDYEIFDYNRAYNELIFPLCTSTYFQGDRIIIDKNIEGTTNDYTESFENTSYGKCSVTLMFVPLSFIAEMVDTYKNSILQFNPRNYLSMSKNPVNKAISEGLELENEDFALLNNGITIVCSSCNCTQKNGLKDSTNVHIEDPQIINGGQTAFTLSRVLHENDNTKLANKKVLLKIIATYQDQKKELKEAGKEIVDYHVFINSISEATNKQTKIEEPDRRANLEIQVEIQKRIYSQFGLLYERKAGEFEEVVRKKIVPRDQIIKREKFVRAVKAIYGDCTNAMNAGATELFEKTNFDKTINVDLSPELATYANRLYAYAQKCESLSRKEKHDEWGNGVKYGKYALISAAGYISKERITENITLEEIDNLCKTCIDALLEKWGIFESYIAEKHPHYFTLGGEKGPQNYYKSKYSSEDVKNYWGNMSLDELSSNDDGNE